MAIVRDITVTLRAADLITPEPPRGFWSRLFGKAPVPALPACPYCGQIDPEPSTHLARVHDGDR